MPYSHLSRRVRRLVFVSVQLTVLSDVAFSEEKAVKVPVPSADALGEARATVKEIYQDDYNKTKTSQEKLALAKPNLEPTKNTTPGHCGS